MRSFTQKTLLLGSALASLTLMVVPQRASAEGLFEMLFGGPVRDRPVRYYDDGFDSPRPRRQERRATPAAPTKPVRIQGPEYYTYRADPLVKVKLDPQPSTMTASATPAEASAAVSPTATDATPPNQPVDFRDSLSAIENADVYAEKDVAAALAARYNTDPTLIWSDGKEPNPRTRDIMRVLADAGTQGLEPRDYEIQVPAGVDDAVQRKADLTGFDVALSARVLRYIRDVAIGRIDPNRISGYFDFPTNRSIDLKSKLDALAVSDNPTDILARALPQSAEYTSLLSELKTLKESEDQSIVVDSKLVLKPGESSAELPKLLMLIARKTGDKPSDTSIDADPELYGPDKVRIVKEAQHGVGLRADGIIGPRTVAAFAETSAADRVEKVRIALEQLRWLPASLGTPRVFVNQPAYTASFIDVSGERLKMDVVVGGPNTQTPFFYDEIEEVDYNPYWGVPASILVNEMLPKLLRDPGYLDRAGYEVFNAKGKHVPSSSVSWGSYGAKIPFDVRQTPSEANALGELKILFPNKNAIYMHDTPQKALFARDMRALSHGCIRLSNPRAMAAAVLDTDVDHIAEKLTHGHSTEKVPVKIPIYISYFTAWPNAQGKVEYFKDVYGRDPRIEAALEATNAVRAPAI